MAFDLGNDLVVVADIFAMAGRDDDQVAAQRAGFADPGAGADAEGLGLIARGDGAGRIAVDGGDDDRSSTQGRVALLFDTGKIAVEVEVQPAEGKRLHGHRLQPERIKNKVFGCSRRACGFFRGCASG